MAELSSDSIEVLSYTRPRLPAPLATTSPLRRNATASSSQQSPPRFRQFNKSGQRLFSSPSPELAETQKDEDDSSDDGIVFVSAKIAPECVYPGLRRFRVADLELLDLNRNESEDDELPDLNELRKTLSTTDHNRRPLTAKDKGKGKASSAPSLMSNTHVPAKRARDPASCKSPSTKAAAAEERAAKKAALEAEKEAKKLLKAANTLRLDRTVTLRELTAHFSGTAFDPLPVEPANAGNNNNNKGKKKARMPSPWLTIASLFKARMTDEDGDEADDKLRGCAVQLPDEPRRDLGSEGAVRWTRLCTRKFNEELHRFVPLPHGKQLIVEEDVRVIFMYVISPSNSSF